MTSRQESLSARDEIERGKAVDDRRAAELAANAYGTGLLRQYRKDIEANLPDVAASFREAVADVLLTKALAACADRGVPRLLLGGGVGSVLERRLAVQR